MGSIHWCLTPDVYIRHQDIGKMMAKIRKSWCRMYARKTYSQIRPPFRGRLENFLNSTPVTRSQKLPFLSTFLPFSKLGTIIDLLRLLTLSFTSLIKTKRDFKDASPPCQLRCSSRCPKRNPHTCCSLRVLFLFKECHCTEYLHF